MDVLEMLTIGNIKNKAKANERKSKFKNSAHKQSANRIARCFFDGNFNKRPDPQAVKKFAEEQPSETEILMFLSNVSLQKQYRY